MNIREIKSARAESFLRIQRRDVFSTVYQNKDYISSRAGESSLFRKRIKIPREKRKTAETQGKELVAQHLEDFNKGYGELKNYDTYDVRRNINYEKNNEKFRLR